MKTLMRIFVWGGGLLLLIALGVVAARPQPILIDVAKVQRGPLQVSIDEDGVTRIQERYIVSTPLAGELERVSLEVGDEVIADKTVIARMQPKDPSLLDPRAVAQARARVRAAERRLDESRSELKKAQSSAELATQELERVRGLAKTKVVATAELEARQTEFRIRSEDARAASFRVDIAEYELELERAALMLTDPDADSPSPGDASMALSIKAPINGRVLRIDQESAAVLNEGASLMEIGDPADLEVVVDVLSVDAVRARRGAPVSLENWGGEQPLRGEVRVIEPAGFTKLSALGVEEQRVNIIVDFVDPPQHRQTLGDGFRVDARIVVWQGDDVLQVPTSSLFRVDTDWRLFVVDSEGRAMLTEVKIGHNNGVHAEILAGVEEGDTVIVHPSDAIETGVAVELRQK